MPDADATIDKIARKRLRADLKAGTAWSKRRAADRREHRARQNGTTGPASPCRLIDPATGQTLGEFRPHIISPPAGRLSLSTSAPKVRKSDWKAAQRQADKRTRDAMGRKPVTITPKHAALCEAIIQSERLSEAECLDEAKVAAEATAILDEWARRWR